MKFISMVTVTGADDTVHPADLLAISEEYPFTEFGILLSRRSMGSLRFPSDKWLDKATELFSRNHINLCGHICGSWVREILMGNWPKDELAAIHPQLADIFDRFQLNTHAEPHAHDFPKVREVIGKLRQPIIVQYDNVNVSLFNDLKDLGIHTLFDLSHGAGILPDEWPRPIDGVRCGYAGGLSPANVADQIEKISTLVGDRTIWIDAETHLRDYSDGDKFSLVKTREFLKAAQPYIIEG